MADRARAATTLPHASGSIPALHEPLREHLIRTLNALTEGLIVRDDRGRLIDCNPAAQQILGLTIDQIVGRAPLPPGWSIHRADGTLLPLPPGTYPSLILLAEAPERETELEIRKPDGQRTWIAATVVPFCTGDDSRSPGALCTFRDVTAHKRAEAAEHEARLRLEVAARAGEVGLWDWDLATNVVVYSDEWKRQIGYEPDEVGSTYQDWEERLHPADRAAAVERVREYLAGRSRDYEVEFRLRHKDGSYRWILARGQALRDQAGNPIRLVGCHIDVTVERLAQAELVRQKQALTLAVDLASLGYWEFDPATLRITLDAGLLKLLRTTAGELGGMSMPFVDFARRFMPDQSRVQMVDLMNQVLAAPGADQTMQTEHACCRADGTEGTWSVRIALVKNDEGRILKCCGVNKDITERKRSDARLARLLEGESLLARLSQRFIQMKLGAFDQEVHEALKSVAHFVGAARAALFLYSEDRSRVPLAVEWSLDPRDTVEVEVRDLEVGRLGFFHQELHAFRPVQIRSIDDLPAGSRERRFSERVGFRPMVMLPLASDTRLLGVLGVYGPLGGTQPFADDLIPLLASFAVSLAHVVGRKNAEEEFVALERQLFQSQKLEAIGTMAGGIAHDFNNILTVIVGNLEVARMDAESGEPIRESLDAIEAAANRAVAVVQQMLAFSRHQQNERLVVSLPAIAAEAVRFIRATIPVSVSINVSAAADVPPVLADPTQMHQILINLCTNSWHAMEGAPGRISLAVEPITLTESQALRIGIAPGACVRLTVADTGCGMNDVQLKRLFEPFFTTKPVGKGTGLGMSVVLGIVQSHGGAIAIDSKVGKGTSVRVYFRAASTAIETSAPVPETVTGHGERLLLVDDEVAVARVVSRGLERLGYQVRTFTDARVAQAAFHEDPAQFDAVIADHEMPEASGLDVTRAIRRVRPDLPVILWSGRFAPDMEDVAREVGVTRLLTKPCEPRELSRIVGEVLQLARDVSGTPSAPRSPRSL